MGMRKRILWKMDSRRKLGWVDHSPFSYDWQVAGARAYRIQQRCQGIRMTLKQAMNA
jgi:hypothetical protein